MMDTLDRIVSEIPKRAAVAQLVGYCEGLCASGVLSQSGEGRMRWLVAQTLVAFDMPSKRERETG